MNINTFNTDRPYSPEGQLINWVIAGTKKREYFQESLLCTIHFHDTTRDIFGKVQVVIEDANNILLGIYIEEQILAAYDKGDYVHIAPSVCKAAGGEDDDAPYRYKEAS